MLQNFVIVGITGVGKTFLELELQQKQGFYAWPKYTDREDLRQEEQGAPNLVKVSKTDFQSMLSDFVFTMKYLNNNYGWRRQDYAQNRDKNITLAMTLENLANFMVKVPGFMPIMLHVELSNFGLIENRVRRREGFENLTPEQQKFVNEKVQERLISARYDLERFTFYQNIVNKYGGKIFVIKDNNTIYEEVIPFILTNKEKRNKQSVMSIANKYR
jgi:guanylate kinase